MRSIECGASASEAPFFTEALKILKQSRIPFLVGGGHALYLYIGMPRRTKDLDIFIHPDDCPKVLEVFRETGYETELHFSHWIGKIHCKDQVIDVIFSSGNGLCPVDQAWFDNARPAKIYGVPVHLCPVEEMIWQKAFIMEHLRYDGGDIAHLILSSPFLDWRRLLDRFGPYWRALLSHLVLFPFIYPSAGRFGPSYAERSFRRSFEGSVETG